MNGLDGIAKQVFEKIRGRFPKIVMGDENGAPVSETAFKMPKRLVLAFQAESQTPKRQWIWRF